MPSPSYDEVARELPLLVATSPDWARLAASNLPVFLADHAVCEQQVAQYALALAAHRQQDFRRIACCARRGPRVLDRVIDQVGERLAQELAVAFEARGLRRVAQERGVRIFERSPMTRLERSRPPRVHTPGGIVTTERVVLQIAVDKVHKHNV